MCPLVKSFDRMHEVVIVLHDEPALNAVYDIFTALFDAFLRPFQLFPTQLALEHV